jgi:hypothetical protein
MFSFSHERVTIPPVNWINTCHRNGVTCLGTFIVEGDQMGELEMLLHGPTDAPVIGDDDPMRLWNPYFADKLGKTNIFNIIQDVCYPKKKN